MKDRIFYPKPIMLCTNSKVDEEKYVELKELPEGKFYAVAKPDLYLGELVTDNTKTGRDVVTGETRVAVPGEYIVTQRDFDDTHYIYIEEGFKAVFDIPDVVIDAKVPTKVESDSTKEEKVEKKETKSETTKTTKKRTSKKK